MSNPLPFGLRQLHKRRRLVLAGRPEIDWSFLRRARRLVPRGFFPCLQFILISLQQFLCLYLVLFSFRRPLKSYSEANYAFRASMKYCHALLRLEEDCPDSGGGCNAGKVNLVIERRNHESKFVFIFIF